MQTQVALSTMEAEYIALSQSMRDLIPIREILKELMTIVFYHCRSPIILTRKLLTIRWAPVIMLFLNRQFLKTTMHVWSLPECPSSHRVPNILVFHIIGSELKWNDLRFILNGSIQKNNLPINSQKDYRLMRFAWLASVLSVGDNYSRKGESIYTIQVSFTTVPTVWREQVPTVSTVVQTPDTGWYRVLTICQLVFQCILSACVFDVSWVLVFLNDSSRLDHRRITDEK